MFIRSRNIFHNYYRQPIYSVSQEKHMTVDMSGHYDEQYFDWQAPIGKFGGWANQSKFVEYISTDSRVLDFGCGGGFLLKRINCCKKVGVEHNPSADKIARENGIEVFTSPEQVPQDYVDVIISNNALGHTMHPLKDLRALHKTLAATGKIVLSSRASLFHTAINQTM